MDPFFDFSLCPSFSFSFSVFLYFSNCRTFSSSILASSCWAMYSTFRMLTTGHALNLSNCGQF